MGLEYGRKCLSRLDIIIIIFHTEKDVMTIEVAIMKKYVTMGLMFLVMLGLLSGCAQNTPKQEVTPAASTEEEDT